MVSPWGEIFAIDFQRQILHVERQRSSTLKQFYSKFGNIPINQQLDEILMMIHFCQSGMFLLERIQRIKRTLQGGSSILY